MQADLGILNPLVLLFSAIKLKLLFQIPHTAHVNNNIMHLFVKPQFHFRLFSLLPCYN